MRLLLCRFEGINDSGLSLSEGELSNLPATTILKQSPSRYIISRAVGFLSLYGSSKTDMISVAAFST